MPRKTPEWIGKTPDTKVPPRVRLRIYDRENGTCHISGRKIQPGEKWELEHKIALILGGEHRESNLFPALAEFHKPKTAAEMKVKSKIADVRKKHLGITRPKQTIQSRGFARKERAPKPEPTLPRRRLYTEIET